MSDDQLPQCAAPAVPTRRVILLGASNLARSFPTIISTAREMWSEPIEFLVAKGHGRSYGQETSVFGRKISGIFPCALWRDLQARRALSTTALVTDIGNDLLYGTTPEVLLNWVEGCLDHLSEAGAVTIVTLLPAESIEQLGERRFQFFRRLLFARSKLTLADARRLVREINERLIEISNSRKISVIPVSNEWYGFDPIHIRRRSERAAWPKLLAAWREANEPFSILRSSPWMIAYLATLTPLEWSRFGIARRTPQPSGRFFDGTTISLY
jgi:hypothetical protein